MTADKTSELTINRIYHGDCLEVMKQIPDKTVDMILCDLPYGVTSRLNWDIRIPLEPLWEHYRRIITDNGAIVLTATEPFSSMLVMSNLGMFRYDLIWKKPYTTGFLNANRMPLRNHEQILIFYKKLPTYNPQKTKGEPYNRFTPNAPPHYRGLQRTRTKNSDGSRHPVSVLQFKVDKERGYHPSQKPVDMGRYLIRTFTNPGDLVLDNACGSGSFCVSAVLEGRNFIGIEQEEEYWRIAKERVAAAQTLVRSRLL